MHLLRHLRLTHRGSDDADLTEAEPTITTNRNGHKRDSPDASPAVCQAAVPRFDARAVESTVKAVHHKIVELSMMLSPRHEGRNTPPHGPPPGQSFPVALTADTAAAAPPPAVEPPLPPPPPPLLPLPPPLLAPPVPPPPTPPAGSSSAAAATAKYTP